MKICNSLLNKCFHGKALFTCHSSCQLAGMLCSWAGNAQRREGEGTEPQQIWTQPGGLGREQRAPVCLLIFYPCGLAYEMH